MKTICTSLLTLLLIGITLISKADTINYFGELPPGYYPELFAEDIFNSTVYTISFSPDCTNVYFSGNYDGYTIKYREYVDGQWTEETEASFCIPGSSIQDASPCFSPDGNRLYFCSNRAGGLGDYDLWYVEKEASGWGEPQNLGDSVNSSAREDYPFVTRENTLYFNSGREGSNGFTDIYCAEWKEGNFLKARQLADTVNTSDWDEDPVVINDKLIFGFHSSKQLAISYKTENGSWTSPLVVSGGLFPKGYYDGFRLSPDGKYFIYSLDVTGNGNAFETYWVDVETLDFLGLKEPPFNYVTGWYAGIREQMQLALHTELKKSQTSSKNTVQRVDYNWMVNATGSCTGCIDNPKDGQKDIKILYRTENIACAKLISNNYEDYMQMVNISGQWKILNVLWEYNSVHSEGDSLKIMDAVTSYVDAWQTGDEDLIKSVLHKQIVSRDFLSTSEIKDYSYSDFLYLTRNCAGCSDNSEAEIKVLDFTENIANVAIINNDKIDLIHLRYIADEWIVVNVLRNYLLSDMEIVSSTERLPDYKNQIEISPNPAQEEIYISICNLSNEDVTIKILNVNGQQVFSDLTYHSSEFLVNLDGLSDGMYFLKFEFDNDIVVRRVCKN